MVEENKPKTEEKPITQEIKNSSTQKSEGDKNKITVTNNSNKKLSSEQNSEPHSMKINKKLTNEKFDKKFIQEFELPEGVQAIIEDSELILKKDDKELRRKLHPAIGLKIEDNRLIIKAKKTSKKEKKIFGTLKAHIKNMIKGLTEGFTYKLQIANVHFPMTAEYDKATNELVVKNFLGEKKDRRIKLVENCEIKVDKENIEITSHDIEKAGQCAANIEKGTKVRGKDRRVYQDGIFITEKPGRSYL